MTFDLILKIEDVIKTLNARQQSIARQLVSDPKFSIFEQTIFDKTDLYLIDLSTNKNYNLITYIKSKCGC